MPQISIYQAAAHNDVEALRGVIHRLHFVEAETGWTALHYAAKHNALEAARWLIDWGADVEAEAPGGVRPLDLAASEEVRALFPEEYRTPLAPHFKPLVHATYLLTLLGDAQALLEFERLWSHRDCRVRNLASEHVIGFQPLHHDHGQTPQQPLDAKRLAELQRVLRDRFEETRLLGLEEGLREPDERLVPVALPMLGGRALDLLPVASRLFRMCCTHEEKSLEALRPFLDMEIPPQPIPADASPDDLAELIKKNGDRAAKQYAIRRYAAQALMYPHGSRALQEYLLAYFADPNRQLKRELNVALQYCPDAEGVQTALVAMAEGAEPLRTSALYALSHFKNPQHRELFSGHLQTDRAETAEAALRGLQPHLEAGDVPALQACRDRWKPD